MCKNTISIMILAVMAAIPCWMMGKFKAKGYVQAAAGLSSLGLAVGASRIAQGMNLPALTSKRIRIAGIVGIALVALSKVLERRNQTGSVTVQNRSSILEGHAVRGVTVFGPGKLTVVYQNGVKPRFEVQADAHLQQHIGTKVKYGTLFIRTGGDIQTNSDIEYRLTLPRQYSNLNGLFGQDNDSNTKDY